MGTWEIKINVCVHVVNLFHMHFFITRGILFSITLVYSNGF